MCFMTTCFAYGTTNIIKPFITWKISENVCYLETFYMNFS